MTTPSPEPSAATATIPADAVGDLVMGQFILRGEPVAAALWPAGEPPRVAVVVNARNQPATIEDYRGVRAFLRDYCKHLDRLIDGGDDEPPQGMYL